MAVLSRPIKHPITLLFVCTCIYLFHVRLSVISYHRFLLVSCWRLETLEYTETVYINSITVYIHVHCTVDEHDIIASTFVDNRIYSIRVNFNTFLYLY